MDPDCERVTDIKIRALRDLIEAKIMSVERATDMATQSLERRLHTMNEFRAALSDQATRFFTRQEHEAYFKLVEADLRVLRESRAELAGKASQANVNVALMFAAVGAITGVSGIIIEIIRVYGK